MASGFATTQSFADFLSSGPPMDGVPAEIVADLRASRAFFARLGFASDGAARTLPERERATEIRLVR